MTAPDAYWEEAHAAFHHCAAEDARVWAEPEASDPGITGDPDAHAAAAAQAGQELMAEWPERAWPGELQQKYGAEPEAKAEPEPEADLGHDYEGPELRSGTPEYEALYAEYQAWAATEPEPEAKVCGPQLPGLRDLYLAQDAPCEANRAGCSDAVYDRLVLERQQTEAAYLAGYDRELDRALEAEAADPEREAEL